MATADQTRTFMKDVKRAIIKLGTAVVTRHDGRLALGRLGALCEQVMELNALGYEVIIVTSGAIGVGKQRLKKGSLSIAALLICKSNRWSWMERLALPLDRVASWLFTICYLPNSVPCPYVSNVELPVIQLDVSASQLLVTHSDFENPNFRERLRETESLLDLKVVPIFNDNDAMSLSLQDSSGIFWDNDSLASLLAIELKADLLVLLSDVDGLYSGPPSEPQSKIIHTYIKEKHHNEIIFGDKSRVGSGGMTAKVKAAFVASKSGTPVVITSAREMAVAARECPRRPQNLSSDERKKILLDVADALEENEDLIRTENEADVAAAQDDGGSPLLS
ncbi:unnamed protein product [Miscanthus lutarioriparius]|uniref:Aspartate/glutamate/uridylate kinase domain-containing protein n=1 Tax=Miscanthus lutarioriparius TaxID=422564 RepID=A0A811RWU5_9POAL|nr:unnamed protein product [Miscanthus lutarioriparius]